MSFRGQEHGRAAVGIDRAALFGNLTSGALWLAILGGPAGIWLVAGGAIYVVVASLFIAAMFAREPLTLSQKAITWGLPWIVAVALWTYVASGIDSGMSDLNCSTNLGIGLLIATFLFAAWQAIAFWGKAILEAGRSVN